MTNGKKKTLIINTNNIMTNPIDNIQWLEVKTLTANEYNPNFVLTKEMELLKFSLLKQGWIQPLLITKDLVIIDGFHRHLLCKNDEEVSAMTDGKVPCAVLEIDEAERIMLTVRINRAKGVHSAVKMHGLIGMLFNDHKLSTKQICEGIGATKEEVDLMLKENVFKDLKVDKHEYEKAWGVREKTED